MAVLGLAGPAAQAAAAHQPLAAVKLTSGKAVNASISSVGQELDYTFAAKAGQHVTFQVAEFDFTNGGGTPTVYFYFYEPGSSTAYTSAPFDGSSFYDFATPVAGTWSVAVIPYSNSVGTFTLTFANDVASQALTSGTATSATVKVQGQNAGYTFAATAGRHVTFQVTNFNLTNGGSTGVAYLDFYEPGATGMYQSCSFAGNGTCALTTPVAGTWTAVLDPYTSSTGSLSLKLTG